MIKLHSIYIFFVRAVGRFDLNICLIIFYWESYIQSLDDRVYFKMHMNTFL